MSKSSTLTSVFQIRKVGPVQPPTILAIVTSLFIINILINYYFLNIRLIPSGYSHLELLFAPIYEEIIFRGLVFHEMIRLFSFKKAFITSCFFFSLWHLKNIFFLSPVKLISQMFYSACIFAPITTYLVHKYKSIWPGVVLHYTNNIAAFIFWNLIVTL